MTAYYNEIDPYCAEWLRNLIAAGEIPAGDVDERPIEEVSADDVRDYTQCHFFAGIGGWAYAARLAGWPDDRPLWTGSCPCQGFSSAAHGRHVQPDLWPEWRRLIGAVRPREIAGEQVASAKLWIDGVCDDLESSGYAVGASILPACGVGQDHQRERIYFAGHAHGQGKSSLSIDAEASGVPWHRSDAGSMVPPYGFSDPMAQIRAFGNAIVPELAAQFLMAWTEATS